MTSIKGFLYSVRNEASEIKELRFRIEELETAAGGIHSTDYSADKVQTSPRADGMESKIVELIEYKDQLADKLNILNKKRQRAQWYVDQLKDSRERQVLDLYFLSDDRMSMAAVADMISYSERETYHIYKRALKHCSEMQ